MGDGLTIHRERVEAWVPPSWGWWNPDEEDVVFGGLQAREGHRYVQRDGWATDEVEMPALGDLLFRAVTRGPLGVVIRLDGALVLAKLGHGHAHIRVSGRELASVEAAVARLRSVLPLSEPTNGRVPVTFWTYGMNGPQSFSRKIDVAPWDAIESNYSAAAREVLDAMMRDFRPARGGQLVLWQGLPGTGKTHALRAVAWEWREWAELHYVVDPEKLFGDHADYLIQVLLSGENEIGAEESGKWKVLVLEDTGEILAADAKDRTGQALSRLLNTVDGLIGQGLKILVLVTTNDELKQLHPAVSRPGRCAVQLVFDRLDRIAAGDWAEAHGIERDQVTGMVTLADLYALAADGSTARKARSPVGFGA